MTARAVMVLPAAHYLHVIGGCLVIALGGWIAILAGRAAAHAWHQRQAARHADLEALINGTREPRCGCSQWDSRGDRPVPVICPQHSPHGKHRLYADADTDATEVFDIAEWEARLR